MSRLDAIITALVEEPGDESLARALYTAVAGTEMLLLLEEEAQGDTIKPRMFPLEGGPVVLAFDSEERLADFAGAAPFCALSGRALAELLAPQRAGLGLNLGTSAEYVLPPDALDWLTEHQVKAERRTDQPIALHAPQGFPQAVLPEIEARLASARGLAAKAVLAEAEYADGRRAPLIAFIAALEGREPNLSALIGEVMAISGLDPSGCDIAFLPAAGPMTERAMAAGLVIDLPTPPQPPKPDPTVPPRLR